MQLYHYFPRKSCLYNVLCENSTKGARRDALIASTLMPTSLLAYLNELFIGTVYICLYEKRFRNLHSDSWAITLRNIL